jgi:hypothetical protein
LFKTYLGCYFHGCPECYKDGTRKLAGGVTAERLWHLTKKRIIELKQIYPEVELIHECEFRRHLKADKSLRQAFDRTYHVEPLHPRNDCLYGGRTELFKAHHLCTEEEEISHLDVVSSKY